MDDEPCVMDIEHCRCIYVTSHPYNMYHQTALFYQDWKPLASSRGDSQGEDGEASGEGDAASGDLDGEPIEESELLGQPLFPDSPLEMLMDELEKQLPEVPVQGPSAPQVPSPKRPQTEESRPKVEAPGIHLDVSPRVVATPCRAESVAPTVLDTPMTKGSSSPESNKAGYYFYLLIACSIHFILMILYIHIHKYNWHHAWKKSHAIVITKHAWAPMVKDYPINNPSGWQSGGHLFWWGSWYWAREAASPNDDWFWDHHQSDHGIPKVLWPQHCFRFTCSMTCICILTRWLLYMISNIYKLINLFRPLNSMD